jgi:glycosyltransferase involved in cell wall biosynthesis
MIGQGSGGSPLSNSSAIFTIVSCNYIGFAATLMQSVRKFHPESDRYIVLSDSYREFPDVDLAAELIACDELAIEALSGMKLWYSVIEFNTAIKPFVFSHLFEEFEYEKICYIDPDILLFGPLNEAFEALNDHNIVLTPHMMMPLQDGKEPSDLTIMKSGVYNLGFLGVRRDPFSAALLAWWSDRLRFHCRVDIPGHMFTDQRWMDLAPVFVPHPFILRHPGYNVAYWNIAHRKVSQSENGKWTVDGQPLVFFHFSGIKPDDSNIFSKHQNRFFKENLGPLQELCDGYRSLVIGNKWKQYAKTRYAFGYFHDGRPLEDMMRRWMVGAIEEGLLDLNQIQALDSSYFDEPDKRYLGRKIKLTRAAYQLWLDRKDLRDAFDVDTEVGCANYVSWFVGGDAVRQGIDGRTVCAVRRLANLPSSTKDLAPLRSPPWPPVAAESWPMASAEVNRFVARSSNDQWLMPFECALLWENRPDLQRHFSLESDDQLDSYLGWALTSGVREGNVHPSNFTPAFLAQLNEISPLSKFYRDVPISQGLIITRFASPQRIDAAKRFPTELDSRVGHAFWFSYLGPKELGWTSGMVKAVRAYFEEDSELVCDAFRLPRALVAPREFRRDLAEAFPAQDPRSVYSYVHWLVVHGFEELGVSLSEIAPAFSEYLSSADDEDISLTRFAVIAYRVRQDLQALFDLDSPEGRSAYAAWFEANCDSNYPHVASQLLHGTSARSASSCGSNQGIAKGGALSASVALTGQWFEKSGRGEDVRCSAISLLAVGYTDFIIVDRASGRKLNSNFEEVDSCAEIQVELNIIHMNAETAFSDWHKMADLKVSAQKTIGFWAWELERLPSYWSYSYSFYDEIWASTKFAKKAFEADKLRPVRLMPMAVVVPERSRPLSRRELMIPEGSFTFLFMFDFRSFLERKNPEAVVRAFELAFPHGDENVLLLIKTQGGDLNPDEWFKLKNICTDPRISLRDLVLEREEVVELVRASDAFVSLHRSEGFGRGPAEAMLLGKPTILTDYSGTADFADTDCAYPVDFTLVTVDVGDYPGVESQRWADASVEHAAEHMRRVAQGDEGVQAVGERARARIVELYSPEVVGRHMLQGIADLRGGQKKLPASSNRSARGYAKSSRNRSSRAKGSVVSVG